MTHKITATRVHDLYVERAGEGYDCAWQCSCGSRGYGGGIDEDGALFAAGLDHESHVREAEMFQEVAA